MSSPRPVQHATVQHAPGSQYAPGSLPGELHGVLEPIVRDAGFELDEFDVAAVGRRHTIRIVVDSDAGVGLDDIAGLSRAAAAELERFDDRLGDSYTIEVTSPGIGRPLTLPRHWRRARLRLVAVRPLDGATFTGRVGAAGDRSVTLLVGGVLRDLPYADVAHAAVEVEFSAPPAAELALLGSEAVHPEEAP